MQTYWPYGSPFLHTPGYQPVLQTTDLTSKYFKFNQFSLDLVKNESARYSLAVFGEIIKEAQRIGACFDSHFPFTNMWTGPQFHRTELQARDLVKDAERAGRVRNQFLIKVMAVNVRAKYIEHFNGCCMLIDDLTYLTPPRVQNLTR